MVARRTDVGLYLPRQPNTALESDFGNACAHPDDAWVDLHGNVRWIDHGKRFLWLRERDGWQHAYVVSRSGEEVRLVRESYGPLARVAFQQRLNDRRGLTDDTSIDELVQR